MQCNSPLPIIEDNKFLTYCVLIVAEGAGEIWIACFSDLHGGFVRVLDSNTFKAQCSKSWQQEETLSSCNEVRRGCYFCFVVSSSLKRIFKTCKNLRTHFNFRVAEYFSY